MRNVFIAAVVTGLSVVAVVSASAKTPQMSEGSYIISRKGSTTIRIANGSFDSFDKLAGAYSGDFILFRQNGQPYLIRDVATIDRALTFFEEKREIKTQRKSIQKRERELAQRQRVLEREQRLLEKRADDLEGGTRNKTVERELEQEVKRVEREIERAAAEIERHEQQFEAEERRLEAEQDRLEETAEKEVRKILAGAVRSGTAVQIRN